MVGLGSSGVGIGLAVTLLDRFTGNAARINASMANMTAKQNALVASSIRAQKRMGMGMAIVGGLGVAAMNGAHTAFRKFDWEMTTISAVTGVLKGEMKGLDNVVKDLSQRSIFDPQEIASASTRLAKAGFTLKQIEQSIESVVMLGTATDTQIGGKTGVADMMAKIMRSFDIPANATSRVADVITKSVNSAAMDMDDAFEALKFLGNTSHNLGLKVEDAMAMVGVLANAGVPQGIAGRGLVNALNKIAISVSEFSTKGNKDALTAIGLSPSDIKDASGNMLSFVDILDKMIAGTAKMGNTNKIAALAKLLRLRGSRAMLPLLSQYNESGGKSFKEFRAMLLSAKTVGETGRVADQRMQSAEGIAIRMRDTFNTMKVVIGEAISPMITDVFKGLTTVMSKITAFVQTPAGAWFMKVTLTGFTFLTVMGLITMATAGLKFAFGGMGAMFGGVFSSMIAGARTFAMATWNAVTAQKALNTTMRGGIAVPGMKGFQSRGSQWVTASGMAGPGMMGSVAKTAGKGILATLGRGLGMFVRFLGPLGMIVSILGMIVGFDNVLKGVKLVLGTVLNTLMLIGKLVWHIASGQFWKFKTDIEDFKKGMKTTQESTFWPDKDRTKTDSEIRTEEAKSALNRLGIAMSGARNQKEQVDGLVKHYGIGRTEATILLENNIKLDGQAMKKQIRRIQNDQLRELLQ